MDGLDDTADTLEDAHDKSLELVALTAADREAIVRALEGCPYGLAELRGVLLLEQQWGATTGLVSHGVSAG